MLSDYAHKLLRPPEIPEGKVGNFRIDRFTMSPEEAMEYNREMWMNGEDSARRMEPGDYLRLKQGDVTWMTDTKAEIQDHAAFVLAASGHVLITGLGLGMVAAACLRKPGVEGVTVIERQPEVLALVAPALEKLGREMGKEARVIHADAKTWVPDREFDWAWHDIWPKIDEDNVPAMDLMKAHYAPYIKYGQECWVEKIVRDMERENKIDLRSLGMGSLSFEKPDKSEVDGVSL